MQTNDTFRIMSMQGLDDVFEKLNRLTAQRKEVKDRADYQRERADRFEAETGGAIDNEINFYQSLVQDFHQRLLLENPNQKTLSTPFGKSKSRRSAAAPEQADKQALLEYVQANDMREFIKEEVKWGDLKKSLTLADTERGMVVVDENGQEVPGVIVKPETVNYSLEFTD